MSFCRETGISEAHGLMADVERHAEVAAEGADGRVHGDAGERGDSAADLPCRGS
jgi:hypothetical protein